MRGICIYRGNGGLGFHVREKPDLKEKKRKMMRRKRDEVELQ